MAQELVRLEKLLHALVRATDSLLLPSGKGLHFVEDSNQLSTQALGALRTLSQSYDHPQSTEQLGHHVSAVWHAWERRRDQLLPAMERGARCGSAFVVAWQPAGQAVGVAGGSETAAAAAPCHACPLPAVQQTLALVGVVCANPLCTRLPSVAPGRAGEEPALERLQRCRGCRVAGYCR